MSKFLRLLSEIQTDEYDDERLEETTTINVHYPVGNEICSQWSHIWDVEIEV